MDSKEQILSDWCWRKAREATDSSEAMNFASCAVALEVLAGRLGPEDEAAVKIELTQREIGALIWECEEKATRDHEETSTAVDKLYAALGWGPTPVSELFARVEALPEDDAGQQERRGGDASGAEGIRTPGGGQRTTGVEAGRRAGKDGGIARAQQTSDASRPDAEKPPCKRCGSARGWVLWADGGCPDCTQDAEEEPCKRCDGDGHIGLEVCPVCHGWKRLPPESQEERNDG